MRTSFRERMRYVRDLSLDEQLEDRAWDYLTWNVPGMYGPRLRRGTVSFIKHAAGGRPSLGWPPRVRPRWRGLHGSWRTRA